MNVQILYATMTGHSRKIANRIAQQLGTEAHDLKQNPKIPPCDLLVIISGIYSGESKPELIEYVKKLSPSNIKKVALVTSTTKKTAPASLRKTLSDAGIAIADDEFVCQGGFLFMAMGHPNKAEIDDAIEFVQKQLKKT